MPLNVAQSKPRKWINSQLFMAIEMSFGKIFVRSVKGACQHRLEYSQSSLGPEFIDDRPKVCSRVQKAREEFSDECSDFDSVARLLNDDDPNVRNDAAIMLLELARLHYRSVKFGELRQIDCENYRKQYGRYPIRLELELVEPDGLLPNAPLIVDRSTLKIITSVLEDTAREGEIASLLKVLHVSKSLPEDNLVKLAIRKLESSNEEILDVAIRVIALSCKPAIDDGFKKVVGLLNTSSSELVQLTICTMLEGWSIELASAYLKELTAFIAHEKKSEKSRVACIELIGTFGFDAFDAISTLCELSIRSNSKNVAIAAMWSLTLIDPKGKHLFDRVKTDDYVILCEKLRILESAGTPLRHSMKERMTIKGPDNKKTEPVRQASVLATSDADPSAEPVCTPSTSVPSTAMQTVVPPPLRKPKANLEAVKDNLRRMKADGYPYPGNYRKLARTLGCSTGILTKIFEAETDLKEWRDNKSVWHRNYSSVDRVVMDPELILDDEIDKILEEAIKNYPVDQQVKAREVFAKKTLDEKRDLCSGFI